MVAFNLRFSGQYFDSETGTSYNYHRTYDPSIGRYLQSDPLGIHQNALGDFEVNTYGYAASSPLVYTDPTGETIGVRCSEGAGLAPHNLQAACLSGPSGTISPSDEQIRSASSSLPAAPSSGEWSR